jgi:hypothetical protein
MLPAIRLNDQGMLHANNINDIRPERLLAFEFEPAQTVGAQVIPEALFSLRLLCTQGFGAVE